MIHLNEIKETAETYYRNGEFYCSEAIIKTIKDAFGSDLPDDIIGMASGFPVGMGGSGCTCGAVSGGVMAIGLFLGRSLPKDEKVAKTMELSKELHDRFREKNRVLCCKILTRGMELGSDVHMKQCIRFTGEVAYDTAEILCRELNKEYTA